MDELQRQLDSLTEIVNSALLLRECESSRKLMFFIRRSLRQMGLNNEWHESEILIEAYLRARGHIQQGKVIRNLPAYLTGIICNLVREKSRERRRRFGIYRKLETSADTMTLPESSYQEEVSDEFVDSLWESFNCLPYRDRKIIELRVVKGYSWNEIANILVASGYEQNYGAPLIAKLRKQGERALAKLRKTLLFANDVES